MTTAERNALALAHMPLARSLARKAAGRAPAEADDLQGAAMLALVQAARDYDASRAPFSVFAGRRVRGVLSRALSKLTPLGYRNRPADAPRVLSLDVERLESRP
jgi:DNA-directed RNA polymerase specialized sigma subunit